MFCVTQHLIQKGSFFFSETRTEMGFSWNGRIKKDLKQVFPTETRGVWHPHTTHSLENIKSKVADQNVRTYTI